MLHDLRFSLAALLAASMCMSGCTGDDGGGEGETETEEGGDETTSDGEVFIPPGARLVEAGMVWRGCLEGDGECDSNESPGGMIEVDAFFLDRFEAIVDDYERCVNAGDCVEPEDTGDCNYHLSGRGKHPVNCLSWDMADAFCSWKGMRLPTEAEWERAARGDALTLYPWGDEAPSCELANVETCNPSTTEGGMQAAGDSPFGISDMVGNVSEWVADYYDADYYTASAGEDNPQGPESGSERVIKGSAFTVPPDFPAQRISKRNFATPGTALRIYGVRCARDR